MVQLWATVIEGILLADYKAFYHSLEYGDVVEAYDVVLSVDQTSGNSIVFSKTSIDLAAIHDLLKVRSINKSFSRTMLNAVFSGAVVVQHIKKSFTGLRQMWFVPQLSKRKITPHKLVALSTVARTTFDALMYPLPGPLSRSDLNLGMAYTMGMTNMEYVTQHDIEEEHTHALVNKSGHLRVRSTRYVGKFNQVVVVLSNFFKRPGDKFGA
jgi:hypothetical protein